LGRVQGLALLWLPTGEVAVFGVRELLAQVLALGGVALAMRS